MVEVAALGIIADSSGVVKATSDMKEMARAAADTSKSVSMFTTAMKSVNQTSMATAAAEDKASESTRRRAGLLDSTLRLVGNVEGATAKYARALDDLNKNLQAGNISASRHAQMTAVLRQRMAEAAAAANVMQAQTGRNTFAITNASYQIQDFAVQIASGTDAMRAFAQQAPQFLGALGFTGKLAMYGSLAGTAVAIGAALIPVLLKTGDGAKAAEEQLDRLNKALDQYSEYSKIATQSQTNLQLSFGNMSEQASNAAKALSQIYRMDALREMEKSMKGFSETFGGLSDRVSMNRVGGMMTELERTQADLQSILRLNQLEVEKITDALKGMQSAASFDEAVNASENWRRLMVQIYGSVESLPPQLQEVTRQALMTALALAQQEDHLNQQQALADDLVNTYSRQAEMNMAIALHGKDSVEVENLRYEAAMRAVEAQIEQNDLTAEQAEQVRAAAEAQYESEQAIRDSEAATASWKDQMAGVAAELSGIAAILASIGGGMIQSAGYAAGEAVLKAGGTAAEAEKARRREVERRRMEQQANTAAGYMPSWQLEMEVAEMERQWAAEDAYMAQLDAARERERASKKSSGGRSGRAKLSDEQRETARLHKEMTREAERWMDRILTDTERLKNEQADLNELYNQGYFGPKGSIQAMDTYARSLQMVREEYDPLISATREWAEELEKGIVDSIMGANSLSDAFYNVAKSIMEAALQASLFGNGPLANFFNVMPGGLFGSMNSGLSASNVVGDDFLSNALRGAFNLSFSGGGYTWSGPRSGGIDGEGGRLGILHPHETVVDHTSGQGSPGMSLNMPIYIDNHVPGVEVKATRNDREIRLSVEQAVKDLVSSGKMDRTMVQRFGVRVSSSGVG